MSSQFVDNKYKARIFRDIARLLPRFVKCNTIIFTGGGAAFLDRVQHTDSEEDKNEQQQQRSQRVSE